MGEALGGANSLGEVKLDALRFDEFEQPFAVAAHVAIDFVERGEFFAFGLGDVEHVHGPESKQGGLGALGILGRLRTFVLVALLADHRGENENAFFSPFNEAAKRVPGAKSGNVAGVGFLPGNQHHIAEGIGIDRDYILHATAKMSGILVPHCP